MSDIAVARPSLGTKASAGYLIAGIALQTPNQDPDAIPTPEAIKFLYNLPRRSIKELATRDTACPICLDKFVTNGLGHEVDVFTTKPEVPMALPCTHVLGSDCAWKLFCPLKNSRENRCPVCRQEFFEKEGLAKNPVTVGRIIRLMDWIIQESRRRLVEGPEEGKQNARESIEHAKEIRAKAEQQRAEMETGRVDDTRGEASGIETITQELRDSRARLDASLTRLMGDEYAQEALVLCRFREQRAILDADLERIREQETVESAAENLDNVAALRERHLGLAHDSLRAARQENEVLRELLTRLR